VRPNCAKGKVRKNGDASAMGWTAEQTSCTNPGSVNGLDRAPPPIASLASSTKTDRPVCASTIAAASPLGPDPIVVSALHVLHGPG